MKYRPPVHHPLTTTKRPQCVSACRWWTSARCSLSMSLAAPQPQQRQCRLDQGGLSHRLQPWARSNQLPARPLSDLSTGRFDWRGACTGTTSRTFSRLAVASVWACNGNCWGFRGPGGDCGLTGVFGCFMRASNSLKDARLSIRPGRFRNFRQLFKHELVLRACRRLCAGARQVLDVPGGLGPYRKTG